MAVFAAFADFGRVWGSAAGEKNGRERVEGGPGPDAKVRRNSRQHAGVGAIAQEKTPTENGWGLVLVEARGVEPLSVSPLPFALHA